MRASALFHGVSRPGDLPRSINYTKSVPMTKLEKELKREISIDDKPYVVTISPQGLKLTEKGRRKGQELSWKDLVSGDAALATALNASVEQPSS
jgi:hypothetical protein